MKKKYLVSLVMSVYNEPIDWIKKSIDSILNQSLSSFEFIIINDNPCRLANLILLEEYLKKDCRIKLILNKKNIGLTKSLNKGLVKAKGKYIARMDADDISTPERLKKQYDYMEKNKDVVLCGALGEKINEKGNLIGDYILKTDSEELKAELVLRNCFIHPVIFIRNKTILLHNLLYNEKHKYAQDYGFIASISKYGKVINLNDKLIYYRVSKNQISQSKKQAQDVIANQVRTNYIKYILESKYKIKLKSLKGSINIINTTVGKKINDPLLLNIQLCLFAYLKEGSFTQKLSAIFSFKYSFLNCLRILKNTFR